MEEIKFKQLFYIDKERLIWNYQRINRMFKNLGSIEIMAKFLINQSVGFSPERIIEILNYFKPKIKEDKTLLDFAFEWIRANRIRFDYKKFINLDVYEDPNSAIDDTIFLFFLDYDNHLREILISDVSELEICALYEIFFNPNEVDSSNMETYLAKNQLRVHTVFKGGEKIDTCIFTLREGLSSMIKKDYNDLHPSKVKIKSEPPNSVEEKSTPVLEFDGTMLERLIKSYCFNKQRINERELENSISRLLSSYFRFGQFYRFEDFKVDLTHNLATCICSGLTANHKYNSMHNLIASRLRNYEKAVEQQKLDGLAWIKDLKPILKKIILRFVDMI
ncbi:MAG: hypothetical protein ACXAAI_07585 [Promethearchaeota archaeon]